MSFCVKMSPEHGKKFMENKIARKAVAVAGEARWGDGGADSVAF